MTAACSSCTSGLTISLLRLDEAARNIAGESASHAPVREGDAVTGATGAPSGSMGGLAEAMVDFVSAEMEFRANIEVFKTAADMVRSLYEIVD